MVKKIEEKGASMLTVHGRTRMQNKDLVGRANWSMIRCIKRLVNIPVVANGGVSNFRDLRKCM